MLHGSQPAGKAYSTSVPAILTTAHSANFLISLLILHMCVAHMERDYSKWCRAVQVRNKTTWANCGKRVPSGPIWSDKIRRDLSPLLPCVRYAWHRAQRHSYTASRCAAAALMQPCSQPKTDHQPARGTQHAVARAGSARALTPRHGIAGSSGSLT